MEPTPDLGPNEGYIDFSVKLPSGTTWKKVFTGWWVMPAVFAVVFGVPVLLCLIGVLLGRGV